LGSSSSSSHNSSTFFSLASPIPLTTLFAHSSSASPAERQQRAGATGVFFRRKNRVLQARLHGVTAFDRFPSSNLLGLDRRSHSVARSSFCPPPSLFWPPLAVFFCIILLRASPIPLTTLFAHSSSASPAERQQRAGATKESRRGKRRRNNFRYSARGSMKDHSDSVSFC